MSKATLTLAYIDTHPGSAAADLAALPAKEAAAFLASIPLRHVTRVIGFASSWAGAGMVQHLPVDTAAGVLRETAYAKAVEILRLMAPDIRETIVKATPRRLQRNFARSLSYPADTVGAAMTIETFAVRPDRLVTDVLSELRSNRRVEGDVVYVVSDAHALLGAADALDLIRAQTGAVMADVMTTDLVSLSARARLASIAGHEAWDVHSHLPVLSRRNHLVGHLSRREVSRRLDTLAPHDSGPGETLLGAIAGAFAHTGAEVARLLIVGDPSRRSRQDGDEPR